MTIKDLDTEILTLLNKLCELLTAAYNDVCQEESKRNATKP